ncbi:NAD(P)-dependent dehydrogenase (short-subunit alcohol dehydrogenase family) [Nocardiopsis mwathae]|uniref:NAD(P)-dependent dehydrogenase (Short-subunit alcohol dehydrogenase family) n=1 Tax=Nocardiopsis mwathae TaxID=1472723 RepID=A0A7W9YLX9_9ACTN|nr:SDR family NAD(P)-dependent oxidoreductase [Nocardiopsis mwathae]MBB6174593.1 NAD(P)-dependent dehydrogenase (short-subunit alcohol dehydrogenase family) [Nocardiopsis mwathae]
MQDTRVVVTGAGRGFGRALAVGFARSGAEVFLSARRIESAEAVRDEIRALGHERVHAFTCDLGDPASVRDFTRKVGEWTDRVDILLNNGAAWLDATDLEEAGDDDIAAAIASGGTGTVLLTKHMLPLLRGSDRPDIVTMVSSVASGRSNAGIGNPAFAAAKGAQANFSDIMSERLRPHGIRVIALYPPDFTDLDPLSEEWESAVRGPSSMLTARSVLDCVLFAVNQPRDCFIRTFEFEPLPS